MSTTDSRNLFRDAARSFFGQNLVGEDLENAVGGLLILYDYIAKLAHEVGELDIQDITETQAKFLFKIHMVIHFTQMRFLIPALQGDRLLPIRSAAKVRMSGGIGDMPAMLEPEASYMIKAYFMLRTNFASWVEIIAEVFQHSAMWAATDCWRQIQNWNDAKPMLFAVLIIQKKAPPL